MNPGTASPDASASTGAPAAGPHPHHVHYLLGLGDDALIYAQRLGEWLTRAPQIEEDMALGNIGLDLLGQARALLSHAGELEGAGRDEDDLAYLRDERAFRNVHLVEQTRGDFAVEMARMLWFSTYQCHLYAGLGGSSDATLAGIAAKASKEVDYHRDHAASWVVRLGDGTDESARRMQNALDQVQPHIAELFAEDEASRWAAQHGIGIDPQSLEDAVTAEVDAVIEQGMLRRPEPARWRSRGGRAGIHSTAMGYLLAEMQHIHRSHPGARW